MTQCLAAGRMIDNWPASMRRLVEIQDSASSPGSGISLDCLWPADDALVSPAIAKHLMLALLPVGLVLLVGARTAVRHVAWKRCGGGGANPVGVGVAVLGVALFLVLMSVAKVRVGWSFPETGHNSQLPGPLQAPEEILVSTNLLWFPP